MAVQKIRLLVNTIGIKANQVVAVDADTAAELVANHQAVAVGDPIEAEKPKK